MIGEAEEEEQKRDRFTGIIQHDDELLMQQNMHYVIDSEDQYRGLGSIFQAPTTLMKYHENENSSSYGGVRTTKEVKFM